MFRGLLKQAAVYGLSSIVGRLLNYLLVPIHSRIFMPHEFGVLTELYAYVGFISILLVMGTESGFFRFANIKHYKSVYSISFYIPLVFSILFGGLALLNLDYLCNFLGYSNHPEYVVMFILVLMLDAITAIPFAKLRQENKPQKFAFIRLLVIGVTILLNLFFLLLLPRIIFFGLTYSAEFGVGYIILANLIGSVIGAILLFRTAISDLIIRNIDKTIILPILKFSWPLMVAGLAGMINETLGRALLKHLLVDPGNGTVNYVMSQLGIYGANFKIAVLMSLFVQTFRYAAEPFFFSIEKNVDAKLVYASLLKFFTVFGIFVFLGIMTYIDIFKYIIDESYWEGLAVVPILLIAYLFYGITYTLSVWYKLSNQTNYGLYISVFGAVITVIGNVFFIPEYSYMASAWTALISYFATAVISYVLGQKFYNIPYQLNRILMYFGVGLTIFTLIIYVQPANLFIRYSFYSLVLVLFAVLFYVLEKKDFKKFFAKTV